MIMIMTKITVTIRVALRRVPSMLRQDSRVKLRRHSLVASPRLVVIMMVMVMRMVTMIQDFRGRGEVSIDENPNLLPTKNGKIFDFVRNPEPEDGSPREVWGKSER